MKRRASATTGPGIVAENSMVWRVGEVCAKSFSTSRKEAEVEHLVGLVEHHDLDVFEAQQALAGEVEQAAGGADDDLRARLELLDLALVGLAAVDGDDLRGAVGGGELEVFGDLHAQFAGRDDDERLHAGVGVDAERLDERKAEAERLAGSRLGLSDDVLARRGRGGSSGVWMGKGSMMPLEARASTMSWSMPRSLKVKEYLSE